MRGLLAVLFRVALLAHPGRIREEYGAAMEATFEDGLEARTGARALVWGGRALLDLTLTGLGERVRGGHGTGRSHARGGSGMADLATDVRTALRGLLRTPGFTAAAVLILALGVGANTAVFSAVEAALLAPPPFPEPERLALVDLADSSRTDPGPPRTTPWSYPKLRLLLEDRTLPVTAVGGFAVRPLTLTSGGLAERLTAEVVTPGYLEALGVEASAGRLFASGDDTEDAPSVVVLGHGLWTARFGADPSLVGRDVRLEGESVRVVGVAPPGFAGLSGEARMWVPVHTAGRLLTPILVRASGAHWMRAVARLEDGSTVEALDARARAVGAAVAETWPGDDPDVVRTGAAVSLAEARTNPQARRSLLLLVGAAGLLLLGACANLAGLLLARSEARARETAVRLSLGSGRWRILRASLIEGALLGVLGGAAALVLASWGAGLLARAWPSRFVQGSWNVRFVSPEGIGVDGPLLLAGVGVAVAAGVLFGALSGLSHLRRDHLGGLRSGGTVDPHGQRARKVLVGVEVAVALVLVVGAGLLLRSVDRLRGVDAGFEARRIVVFQVPRGPGAEDHAGFSGELLARLRSLPGVEEASMGCAVPAASQCWIAGVRSAGASRWAPGDRPSVGLHPVEGAYFATLGVPLLEGRTLLDSDDASAPPVAVLSRRAAERLFPDGDALGNTLSVTAGLTPEDGPSATVVGIVADVRYGRPEEGFMPEVYLSHLQEGGAERVVLRTAGEPLSVIPAARAELAAVDADVPLVDVRDLRSIEAAGTAETRGLGTLLAIFAALALALAATGVWAVVAWTVQRRTRELGLRMALGASGGRVVGLGVREGLLPVAVGLAVGGGAAWAGSRLLGSFLFEVGPADPVSWVAAVVVLGGVGALAAWLPARRATRVDPMEALRAE